MRRYCCCVADTYTTTDNERLLLLAGSLVLIFFSKECIISYRNHGGISLPASYHMIHTESTELACLFFSYEYGDIHVCVRSSVKSKIKSSISHQPKDFV